MFMSNLHNFLIYQFISVYITKTDLLAVWQFRILKYVILVKNIVYL